MVLVLGLLEESRDSPQWQVAPPGHSREITTDDAGSLGKWIEGRDGVFRMGGESEGIRLCGWCQRLERSKKGVYQMDNPLDLPGALAGDRLSRWRSGKESACQLRRCKLDP